MTSHDIVDFIRRQWKSQRPAALPEPGKMPKVGHLGTLDPDAAGVLPLALGSATRLIQHLPLAEKAYVAEVTFGLVSDTLDLDGEVSAGGTPPEDLAGALKEALEKFSGTIMQVPPRVSALRRDGQRGYDRARKGEDFEFEARPAHYHKVSLLECNGAKARVHVACGPGTYVRALARDLGDALGCGALLSGLVRTRSGPFKIERAVTLEELLRQQWPLLTWHWPFPQRSAGEGFVGVPDGPLVITESSGRGNLVKLAKGSISERILAENLY